MYKCSWHETNATNEVTPPSAKIRNNPVCSIVDSAAEAESREQRALSAAYVQPVQPLLIMSFTSLPYVPPYKFPNFKSHMRGNQYNVNIVQLVVIVLIIKGRLAVRLVAGAQKLTCQKVVDRSHRQLELLELKRDCLRYSEFHPAQLCITR